MSVTFIDNSAKVKQGMNNGIEAALTKIGIAAKQNAQKIILEKDIVDTGELLRTMDYNVRTGDKAVDIGSPKNYAVFQEMGTVKQSARPFLAPAILNNIGQYQQIAGSTIGASVSAGGLMTTSEYYQDDIGITNV